jgi:hypothetical protein
MIDASRGWTTTFGLVDMSFPGAVTIMSTLENDAHPTAATIRATIE